MAALSAAVPTLPIDSREAIYSPHIEHHRGLLETKTNNFSLDDRLRRVHPAVVSAAATAVPRIELNVVLEVVLSQVLRNGRFPPPLNETLSDDGTGPHLEHLVVSGQP